MTRQIFITLLLSAFVFSVTHNCFGHAQVQGAQKTPTPPHEPTHTMKASEGASPAQKYFTDVELLNQNGEKVRFYTDVLKGKTVVVNAFFTTCTSVCPPMNRNLERVQEALGDRLGRDVFLVSVSVDPETDTPTRLKEYSKKFHA